MASAKIMGNDLERFRNDITEFRNSLTDFSNAYQRANGSVQSLNGMWEGPAKNALLAMFAQDDALVNEMIGNLNKICEAYEEAHKAYTQCEISVADLIASMNVGEV
ncbi:MAG: WXG100 family type VII secretion target [Lachnospiraceae bacterium]|nr:WXG100 family type VII secretion target [Lachnospiraceae bacterium]